VTRNNLNNSSKEAPNLKTLGEKTPPLLKALLKAAKILTENSTPAKE